MKGDGKIKTMNWYKWKLCHAIINTVRAAAGVELSQCKNPYAAKAVESYKYGKYAANKTARTL